jgi:hypothetical protein
VVIMLMIIVTIIVIPRLVNEISETFAAQRADGGRYVVRSDEQFAVLIGHFEDHNNWLFLADQLLDKVPHLHSFLRGQMNLMRSRYK